MSAENVSRFLETIQDARRPGETPREFAQRMAKLSQQTSHPFTAADFLQYTPPTATGELTVEQLYAIAGMHISEENERAKKDLKSIPWSNTSLAEK